MLTQKTNGHSPMTVQVTDDLNVQLFTNPDFGFLMDTNTVAVGYGVSPNTIRAHKISHRDELIENHHYVSSVEKINPRKNLNANRVYWTKSGVIKLGFFIKSERAKAFRCWAENVILEVTSKPVSLPVATKRKDNRLTPDRLLDIMQDIILIEDLEVRKRLTEKLMKP
jgi:hypothetical protein